MRTTVRIREDLLRRAKRRAAEQGRSMTSLIEEGLALIVAEPKPKRAKRVELPVSEATGGLLPGVDLRRSSDLEEVMSAP